MSLVKKLTAKKYGLDDIVVAGTAGIAGAAALYNIRDVANISQQAYSNYIIPGVKKLASGLYDTLTGIHNIYYGLASTVCNVVSNVAGVVAGGLVGVATYGLLVYGTYKSLKFTIKKVKANSRKLYQKIKSKLKK